MNNNQSNSLYNIEFVQDISYKTAANYSGGIGRINDGNNDPDVILYSEPNGQGSSIYLNAATGDGIPNIGFNDGVSGGGETGFNDFTSSIVIRRGAWQFYEGIGFVDVGADAGKVRMPGGEQRTSVLGPGTYNLGANDNKISAAFRTN